MSSALRATRAINKLDAARHQVGTHEIGQRAGAHGCGEDRAAAEGREGDGGVGGRAAGGDELVKGDDLVVGAGRRLDELDHVDDGEPAEQADGTGGRW